MAKIGVITFSDTTDNYGQVLQYLAIHEYLKQRGHEPFLLRYKSKKSPIIRRILSKIYHAVIKPTKKAPVRKSELMELYDRWTEWSKRNNNLHPRHFEEFRSKFFKLKTIVGFDDKQIQEFDAYAIGSDQIWSYVGEWNFLGFVPKGLHRFAIAPSTGNKSFSTEQIHDASVMLKEFSFVTCREDSGLEFCKKAGYENAIKLLDPTFLIEKDKYNNYTLNNETSEPYIFVYLLGAECEVSIDRIYEFAQKHNLRVKYVASQGREDSYEKIWATVPEWITLMKDASYIITNSYHGMALSIIYQKQFLVLPLTGITSFMNERITSLASIVNLQDRMYKESLEELFLPINYHFSRMTIDNNLDTLNKKMSKINY